jgi:hypothetical protein
VGEFSFSLLFRLSELISGGKIEFIPEPPSKTLYIVVFLYERLYVGFSTLILRKVQDLPKLGLANPDSLSHDDDVAQSGILWSAGD